MPNTTTASTTFVEPFDVHHFIQQSNLIDLQYDVDGKTVIPGLSPGDPMYDRQLEAWEWLESCPQGYAKRDLALDIHRLLTRGVIAFERENASGRYRHHEATVGGNQTERAINVPIMMEDFLMPTIERRLTHEHTPSDAYQFAWWAHNTFECIHPFTDGNGRTGRLLMIYIQRQLGVEPTVIWERQRWEYYEKINEFRECDYDDLRTDFLTSRGRKA